MNVVLSVAEAGKSTLVKNDDNFRSLDVFDTAKATKSNQISVIHDYVKYHAQNGDETKTYLMNINKFEELGLEDIEELKVTDIVLITEADIDFRKSLYLSDLGKTEDELTESEKRRFERLITRYETTYLELGKKYSEMYGVDIHYLEEGKYLYDYFHGECLE